LPDHDSSGVLDADEHTPQQDGHGPVIVIHGHLGDGSHDAHNAGVVHHDVEAAEPIDGKIDGARHISLVGNIEPHRDSRITKLARRHGRQVKLEVGHDHPSSFGDESASRGGPDAAGSASNDGDRALQTTTGRHIHVPL
jgi:hypothetical protein